MLNVILIFGMLFNLAAGYLLIARLEPIVWGRRGVIVPRKAPVPEWEPPAPGEQPEEDQA